MGRVSYVLWYIFVGLEKGKFYPFKEIFKISLRRGVAIGIIAFLFCLPSINFVISLSTGIAMTGLCTGIGCIALGRG